MKVSRIRWSAIAGCALALLATGCRRDAGEITRKFGFDEFVPVYNRHIAGWLKEQQAATDKEIAATEAA